MSDHHHQHLQQLRHENLRTTSQLFREATSLFRSNLAAFLILSVLLFCFRSTVEDGTRHVTSFIDRDPSLKALLSRLDLSGSQSPHAPHDSHDAPDAHRHSYQDSLPRHLRRRRRPFLHLTRVGTLDDDFFSGDDDDDRTPFGSNRKAPINGTFLILNPKALGFSDRVIDHGININEIVRTGITFRSERLSLSDNGDENEEQKEEENETIGLEKEKEKEKVKELDRIVDFQFFLRGVELSRRDAATLLFLGGIVHFSVQFGKVRE
nr:hypothetical protein CFP56_14963 [Quercus suber]